MKIKKSTETSGREQLRKFHESRSNSSDTDNIGDHLNTTPKPKRDKKRMLTIGNWEVKRTKSISSYARETNGSLINTTKFAVEKKSHTSSKHVQVDTFKFLNEPKSGTKSPFNTKKMAVMFRVSPPLTKKQHGRGKNEKLPEPSNPQKNEPRSGPELIKPWIQYSHNAQNALSLLNKEASSALCEVLGDIDNLQMRVRATVDEIKECERVYQHLRQHKLSDSTACHSSPIIPGVSEPLPVDHTEILQRALDVGLIQTQSENQIRIAVLSGNKEIEVVDDDPKAPSITETEDEVLTKSKKILYNIPAKLELSSSDDESTTTATKSKRHSNLLVVSHKTESLDVGDKLPRKCAHANLHRCLLKEFEANDSLLEFQKRMKPKLGKKKSNPQKKIVEIHAETLYIPEKINKISATILHSENSDKKFLYQETTNKCTKKSLTITKYPDSLFFLQSTDSKSLKSGNNQCNIIIETVGQTNYSLKQECSPLNHSTGLDCFDILDEITLSDIKPLKSEYPRRDVTDRQVENTFLYKLVYDSMQDQFLQLLRLEEPILTCAQQCDKCKSCAKFEKIEDEVVEKKKTAPEIILPKKVSTKKLKKTGHDEIVSKLRQYMFDPHIRFPTTITVMPVVITTYTNPNFVNATTPVEKHSGGDFTTNKKCPKPTKSHAKEEKPKKWNVKQSRAKPVAAPSPRHGESWGDFESTPKRTPNSKHPTDTKTVALKQTRGAVTNKLKKSNRKWETNIQSLIELVEHKIVDILSNPQKTHFEAFKSVEAKILELLNSQKSLETIEENSTKKTKFLSKTTSTLDKMKKRRNGFTSKTDPALLDNTRSLPLHVMRLNLKAPTLKCRTVDESTVTTKSILVANLKSEQTSCTFTEVSRSLEVINFLDTLANISNTGFGDVRLRKTRFYKLPVRLSYPFSLPAQFYPVTLYHSLSLKNGNRLNPPTISSHSPQRNSSLPIRTYKILPKKKSSRTVTFKTNKNSGKVPKASEDYVECITVHQFDYSVILNYVYAALFTIEFLGLVFNYSCE